MSDLDVIYTPRRPQSQIVTSVPASYSPTRRQAQQTALQSSKSVFDRIYDQIINTNTSSRSRAMDAGSDSEEEGNRGSTADGRTAQSRKFAAFMSSAKSNVAPATTFKADHQVPSYRADTNETPKYSSTPTAMGEHEKSARAPAQNGSKKTPFRFTSVATHHKLYRHLSPSEGRLASPPRQPSPRAASSHFADPTQASFNRKAAVMTKRRQSEVLGDDDETEIEAMIPLASSNPTPIRKANTSSASIASSASAMAGRPKAAALRQNAAPQTASRAALGTTQPFDEASSTVGSELASPFRHLSRTQLAEQLATYAEAYVDERDALEAAEVRVAELSHLADTSTSMAEESDRTCKILLGRLETASDQLNDKGAKLVLAQEENKQLTSALEDAKRREADLEKRLASVRQTSTGLEEVLFPLQKEHEKLRLESQHHHQELLSMKTRHELGLQSAYIKHEAEAEHLREAILRLEREVKELRESKADIESAHNRERKDTAAKLSDAYTDVDKGRAANEALRVELRAVADAAESERTNHVRQEQVYLTEVESLKGRITALTGQYEQCYNRRNELEREMVAVRDSHNAMTVKVKTTLAELETTDAEKESRRMLERQNLEMEKQILDLRATLQTFMVTRRIQ